MPLLLGSEEHTSELQSPCNLVCLFCLDRKSTRLNSSHLVISYAVFCLKKKHTGKSARAYGNIAACRGQSRVGEEAAVPFAGGFCFFFKYTGPHGPPLFPPACASRL